MQSLRQLSCNYSKTRGPQEINNRIYSRVRSYKSVLLSRLLCMVFVNQDQKYFRRLSNTLQKLIKIFQINNAENILTLS